MHYTPFREVENAVTKRTLAKVLNLTCYSLDGLQFSLGRHVECKYGYANPELHVKGMMTQMHPGQREGEVNIFCAATKTRGVGYATWHHHNNFNLKFASLQGEVSVKAFPPTSFLSKGTCWAKVDFISARIDFLSIELYQKLEYFLLRLVFTCRELNCSSTRVFLMVRARILWRLGGRGDENESESLHPSKVTFTFPYISGFCRHFYKHDGLYIRIHLLHLSYMNWISKGGDAAGEQW